MHEAFAQAIVSEPALSHEVINLHVPTFGLFCDAVKTQIPSVPLPLHASLSVYEEHLETSMQLVPLETHFKPTAVVEQAVLVVTL